jgi:hypothetical protein
LNKYESGIAKRRDILIIFGGIVLTAVFYINYGNMVKPLIFSSIVLAISLLYSIFFDSWAVRVPSKEEEYNDISGRYYEVCSIANSIKKSLRTIKIKSKQEPRLLIVHRFLKEIEEFNNVIPKLVRSYRKGLIYISGRNTLVFAEIKDIERKLINSKGIIRYNYKKALNEKRAASQEMDSIKVSLSECESRLYYILGTVQKIEAIIEATRLSEGLGEKDATNLNNYMSTFSEDFKDIVKTMRL